MSLLLLPGLGANPRMYDPLRREIDLATPPWPKASLTDTLSTYAKKYIDRGDLEGVRWIGGSSFGGMVALEIAKLHPVDGVVLIGSCRSPGGIADLARALSPLVSLLPNLLYRVPPGMHPLLIAKFGIRDTSGKKAFERMLNDVDASFLKWGISAIMRWKGVGSLEIPVRSIHGAEDRIIPARKVQADRILPGAGHMIAMTHPKEVAEFLP